MLNTYIRFQRAAESVTTRIHRDLPKHQLSFSQYGALEALYHLGPLCQRDLAAKLLKSARNITMVVDNLEKRGLVRRERDSQDRRYLHVHLTEEGARAFEAVFPSIKAGIIAEMGTLTPEEQDQFGAFCLRLGKRPAAG
ncbi:MAG: MarR family transcriptional regulator [Deltaproteobacteria bacterium]|nr:MarR family transcriptional regulator [Deltaproteobacteria bacterium]